MDDDFDWIEARDSIVIKEVSAIAVYQNPNGDVVIRQKCGPNDECDSFVVLPKSEITKLITAVKRREKEVGMLLKTKKWSDFQHYKNRCPPWIKLHRNLTQR